MPPCVTVLYVTSRLLDGMETLVTSSKLAVTAFINRSRFVRFVKVLFNPSSIREGVPNTVSLAVPESSVFIYAIEQVEGSISLTDIKLDKNKKYAVVLGNEVKGVQQSVVDKCTGSIEIPQFGTKHSLNVSVTAGLVIWDFFKQLGI